MCVESVRNQPEPPVAPSQPSTTAELQKTETVIKEEEPPSINPPTAHVRPTHPLKSFSVPTVTVSTHNPPTYETALPSTPLLAQPGLFSKKTNMHIKKTTVVDSLTCRGAHSMFVCVSVPGVKTASIGTLNRVRAPMAVTVPSAPDQSETSQMLDMVSAGDTSHFL